MRAIDCQAERRAVLDLPDRRKHCLRERPTERARRIDRQRPREQIGSATNDTRLCDRSGRLHGVRSAAPISYSNSPRTPLGSMASHQSRNRPGATARAASHRPRIRPPGPSHARQTRLRSSLDAPRTTDAVRLTMRGAVAMHWDGHFSRANATTVACAAVVDRPSAMRPRGGRMISSRFRHTSDGSSNAR